MKKSLLPIIFMLFQISSIAQCIEENTTSNNATGNTAGIGQNFTACASGEVEELQFRTGSTFISPTVNITFRNSSCSVIWTVNDVPTAPSQIITVDMSTGSGSSRSVVAGSSYTFQVLNTAGNGSQNRLSTASTNPYADGHLTSSTGCGVWVLPEYDLWFRVGIGQSLPIELIDFSAIVDFKGNKLSWQTASESQNFHFQIQHSTNAKEWQTIGKVNGAGTTTEPQAYTFTHRSPAPGVNYYRLKQVDFDDNFSYSKIISLFVGDETKITPLSVYPNPVTDELFLENQTEERLIVELFDMSGKYLSSVKIADTEKVSLPVNAWQAGLYFLKINDGRQVHVQRFSKN